MGSLKTHCPFLGTPLGQAKDTRFAYLTKGRKASWKCKCRKQNQWFPQGGVWFPQFYGRIVKILNTDSHSSGGLKVNYVRERISRGKDLVRSISPLWNEGLLLFRCSVFTAVLSGVCLLVWYGRLKAKEYVESRLLPSVCSVLSERIQREVDFGKVQRITPLSLTMESCSVGPHLEEFSCGEAATLKVRIRPFASLRRGKVVVDAILFNPTLLVSQKKDYTWLGIPYYDDNLQRHLSTEEGIDHRTRTRRAAREEAGAQWERERDAAAKQAAVVGYIVPEHMPSGIESDAGVGGNGLGVLANGRSFPHKDEEMHWTDHHSTDTDAQYSLKHADMEKSFGVSYPRSRLKSLPRAIFSSMRPRFKTMGSGRDNSISDVIVKKRILEHSARAAAHYFQVLEDDKVRDPAQCSAGYGILRWSNDISSNEEATDEGTFPSSGSPKSSEAVNRDDFDSTGEKIGGSKHSGLHYQPMTLNLGTNNDGSPFMADSVDQTSVSHNDKDLPSPANAEVHEDENVSGKMHSIDSADSAEDMHGSLVRNWVSEDVECTRGQVDEKAGSREHILDSQGDHVSSGLASAGHEALSSGNHSPWPANLRSTSDFLSGNIGEKFSFLFSNPFKLQKSGMVENPEGIVSGLVNEADEVQIERMEKMLPVTLDSVYFKGGTLMLMAYGDAEPREMENVDGHIKFQNHYGSVHVNLSGDCKMWRADTEAGSGGWLSCDVFVDIIEQTWHANLKLVNFFVPLFERLLEIPILWSKGRASGEVHICMSRGDTFPSILGQLDVTGLSFQILDSPSSFSEMSAILSFRGQRIFLHNCNGQFGNVPLEASGDFGIHPEEGEFHLMCQVPSVEVNSLMKSFKMKPLPYPLAGSVTAIFNCQGPLDAPIFVGSGMITRKIGQAGVDLPVSTASEAVMKSKDAGAVAAFDRIPVSYLSANFTFNTDNCVADLYGIRASLVDGGEIRGAGNAWICPEAEFDETALDVNFSGNLSFNRIVHRYLPSNLHLLPAQVGELKGETKVSGCLLRPRFDMKWNAPKAEGSFTDARGDVVISHDFISVNSTSTAFDLYAKILTSYPETNLSILEDYVVTRAEPLIIEGLELDLRMRGFEFFNIISSYTFDSPRPVQLKATGRVKFQGQVIKPSDGTSQQTTLPGKNTVGEKAVDDGDIRSLSGDVSISGLKLNQLMLAPQLAGHLRISQESMKFDAVGRPDESLAVEMIGLWDPTAEENAQHGKSSSFSLQKGQLRANMFYQPSHAANLEIRHLPLDELELGSLRGNVQRAEIQLNLQKRRGFGVLSVLRPKFSGVLGEALDVAARWSGDVITVEKTILEQSYSRYELQGEYVLPGSRDRKSNPKEIARLFSRAMAGHLGSVISSMGRWRMRLEVPRAEAAEMLPLARLVSRSTDPAVHSRSKDFFMECVQSIGLQAESPQKLLEVIQGRDTSMDEVISDDLSLPGLAELRGRWHGSLDASGGGNGDTVADFDFHGEDWEWGAYKTQRVQAVGAYSNDDGLRLEKIFIQKDNATIHADGTLFGPKTNLHFAVLNFPVSLVPMLVQVIESSATDAIHSMRQMLAPLRGILHMEGDLRGNLLKPECDVQVRLLDGAIGGIDLGRAEVVASLTSSSRFLFNAKFEPIIQNGHVHVQGSVPVTFAHSSVQEEDKEVEEGKDKWKPGWAMEGAKESHEGDLEKKTSRDKHEEGWDIQFTESLKGLNWNLFDDGEVRVDADIKDGGMMLLTALSPHANWLNGNAEVMLQVRGTVQQPELDGSATFHRASVSSPVLRKPMTNFGGKVLVQSNRLCINSLEGRVSRRGKLLVKGNLPLTVREACPGDKIDLKCEVLEVKAKNLLSGQVDTQLQVTGSIMQPCISGKIKMSHGEAYLPHDKGGGVAPFNRLASNQSRLSDVGFNRTVAARYVSRFFTSEPTASKTNLSPSSGRKAEVGKEMEQTNRPPNVDVRLDDLKLVLGPELRIVYPLILNFAVSGELELNGPAHPKLIKPKGVLTFENGDVNLVATQIRLKRDHLNIAKFEPDNGMDPTLDIALVGSEWQFRIQGRASNWQEKLVVTSTRTVEPDVISPEAARVFESQLAESILEGDGQLALKKIATSTLESLMPRIEGKGEIGQARWRLVYAPQIPSLLSVDPTVDPLKSLASNISFGTEVEVQLGKRLQESGQNEDSESEIKGNEMASIVRQMKDSEMAMQWTLIYKLTSRLRVLLQSAPSKRLLFEYSASSQD